MSSSARILVFGHDDKLLETRSLLLQKTGSSIQMAVELYEAHNILLSWKPNLLILCHTISAEEAEQILGEASRSVPKPNDINMTINGTGYHSKGGGTVDALAGPRALLMKVKEVLKLDDYCVQ